MKKLSMLLLALCLMAGPLFAQTVAKKMDKGDGTEANPYVIENLAHLRWLSENEAMWDSHFAQTADIDAAETASWNENKGFSPIGNFTTPFTGGYDGQGHKISGLTIKGRVSDYMGLFGKLQATVQNLTLENPNVKGTSYIGSLVGVLLDNSVVLNCHAVRPQIEGSSHSVGGLVGYAEGSGIRLEGSSVSGNGSVKGDANVGGLVGLGTFLTATRCYSAGITVHGSGSDVGGFVGFGSGGSYTDCYSHCAVSSDAADAKCGGFVGKQYSGELTRCYATGSVTRAGSLEKGFGFNGATDGSPILTHCYFQNNGGITNTPSEAGKCEGKTQAQLQDGTLPEGFDAAVWRAKSGEYPAFNTTKSKIVPKAATNGTLTLKHAGAEIPAEGKLVAVGEKVQILVKPSPSYMLDRLEAGAADITGSLHETAQGLEGEYPVKSANAIIEFEATFVEKPPFAGNGTVAKPFEIATLEHLKYLSGHDNLWKSHFVQTADIDASETKDWNDGEGFSPIGNRNTKFTGHYNGQGHTIAKLTIKRAGSSNQGLFGWVDGGVIKNLHLLTPSVEGENSVGSLVGYMNGTTARVSGCTATSPNVKGNDYAVGGLIGYSRYGVVKLCAVTGEGLVEGPQSVGGLAGNAISLEQCYSEGVTLLGTGSEAKVGGLVANLYSDGSGITNCYSRCPVQITDASVEKCGGLVGVSRAGIKNSYATGMVSVKDGEQIKTKGLLGSRGGGRLTHCYYQNDGGITNAAYADEAGKCEGKTQAQLQDGTLPEGFDAAVWSAKSGEYPALKNVKFAGSGAKYAKLDLPTDGSVTVTGKSAGDEVDVDSEIEIVVNVPDGHKLDKLTVNDEDITSTVVDGKVNYTVPAVETLKIRATFISDENTGIMSQLLASVRIAPNPFSALLTLHSAQDITSYALVNALGSTLLSGVHDSATTIVLNTASLPSGLYLLRLEAHDGVRFIKVMKE